MYSVRLEMSGKPDFFGLPVSQPDPSGFKFNFIKVKKIFGFYRVSNLRFNSGGFQKLKFGLGWVWAGSDLSGYLLAGFKK